MKASIYVGVLLLAATLNVRAETTPGTAQLKTCSACHGDQGQGNALIGAPRLAGQQADYIVQQLRNFKAGRRGYDAQDLQGTQMRAVVGGLDEADFEPLARHFAQQSLAKINVADTGDTLRGENLYKGTCMACHGPQGQGFAHLKTPNLSVLDANYLDRQLSHYAQGLRGSDQHSDQLGIWMRGISLQIGGPAERKAVIDYIGSLPSTMPDGVNPQALLEY